MGAVPEFTHRKITVHAQETVAILGESLTLEPGVESGPRQTPPLIRPIAKDVIDREEFPSSLPAAPTLAAIGLQEFVFAVLAPLALSLLAARIAGVVMPARGHKGLADCLSRHEASSAPTVRGAVTPFQCHQMTHLTSSKRRA